jgi:hypothetical protein
MKPIKIRLGPDLASFGTRKKPFSNKSITQSPISVMDASEVIAPFTPVAIGRRIRYSANARYTDSTTEQDICETSICEASLSKLDHPETTS